MNHIHIGPGCEGLALPVAQVRTQSAIKTYLIARLSHKSYYNIIKSQGRYRLSFSGHTPRTSEIIEPVVLYFWDDPEVYKIINDPETALLTTTVRAENLPSAAENIARLLESRSKCCKGNQTLFIIACENIPNNSNYLRELILKDNPNLHAFLNKNIIFLNTIVDRISQKIEIINNEVVVEAEPFKRWIIELPYHLLGTANEALLRNILGSEVILASPEQFDFYEKQKLWLLNGIHLAIAIYAFLENDKEGVIPESHKYIRTVDAALCDHPSIVERIKLIQDIFSLCLRQYCIVKRIPPFPDMEHDHILRFNQDVIQRFKITKGDPLGRIVGELLKLDIIDITIKEAKESIVKEFSEALEKIKISSSSEESIRDAFLRNTERTLHLVARQMDVYPFLSKLRERILEPLDYLPEPIEKKEEILNVMLDLLSKTLLVIGRFLKEPSRYLRSFQVS